MRWSSLRCWLLPAQRDIPRSSELSSQPRFHNHQHFENRDKRCGSSHRHGDDLAGVMATPSQPTLIAVPGTEFSLALVLPANDSRPRISTSRRGCPPLLVSRHKRAGKTASLVRKSFATGPAQGWLRLPRSCDAQSEKKYSGLNAPRGQPRSAEPIWKRWAGLASAA
jgi:hypothetical protein